MSRMEREGMEIQLQREVLASRGTDAEVGFGPRSHNLLVICEGQIANCDSVGCSIQHMLRCVLRGGHVFATSVKKCL